MERRAYPRVEVSHSALYVTDFCLRPAIASTRDISLGGIRIESPYSLFKDEGLEIAVTIGQQAIKCRGKVVDVLLLENGKMEAGIQFQAMSGGDKLYLRQYLFRVVEQQAISSLSSEETPH